MSVVQSEGTVQPNGHPHTITDPRQLSHLTLTTGVSIERFLTINRDDRRSVPLSQITLHSHEILGAQTESIDKTLHTDPLSYKLSHHLSRRPRCPCYNPPPPPRPPKGISLFSIIKSQPYYRIWSQLDANAIPLFYRRFSDLVDLWVITIKGP